MTALAWLIYDITGVVWLTQLLTTFLIGLWRWDRWARRRIAEGRWAL